MKNYLLFLSLFLVFPISLKADEVAKSSEERVGKVVAFRRTIQIEMEKCRANFKLDMDAIEPGKSASCAVPTLDKDFFPQYNGIGMSYNIKTEEPIPRVYLFAGPVGYRFAIYGSRSELNWEHAGPLFERLLKDNHLGSSYQVDFTKVVPE